MIQLAVTTRSHLKGVRFLPSMVRASLRIRRQLAGTPGCIRFASIFMSGREVWTITVWRSRQEMLDFMRSGAHEDIMWDFSRWLDSFWLMRWRPSEDEDGHWDGLCLAMPLPSPGGGTARRTGDQARALEAVYEAVPRLRAAAGPSGAASFEHSPAQRKARRLVAGGVGATVRLRVPAGRSAPAWRELARMRRCLLARAGVLRCAIGISRPGELYVLAVFRSEEAWREFRDGDWVARLRSRWPDGLWLMRWEADNEFGHWDGLRLRRVKLGTKVSVPDAALRAAGGRPGAGARTRR